MKPRFLAGALTAFALSLTPASMPVVQAFRPAPAPDHGDCAQLAQLTFPDAKITEAVAVPAGAGAIKVAHCRVNGVIGTEIKFSLLLPDAWNHKFLMGGGGGFV